MGVAQMSAARRGSPALVGPGPDVSGSKAGPRGARRPWPKKGPSSSTLPPSASGAPSGRVGPTAEGLPVYLTPRPGVAAPHCRSSGSGVSFGELPGSGGLRGPQNGLGPVINKTGRGPSSRERTIQRRPGVVPPFQSPPPGVSVGGFKTAYIPLVRVGQLWKSVGKLRERCRGKNRVLIARRTA